MRLIAIGGGDAGISAALRARELDPSAEVTVVLPARASAADYASSGHQRAPAPATSSGLAR